MIKGSTPGASGPQPVDANTVLIEEYEHLAPGQWVPSPSMKLMDVFSHIHRLPSDEQPTALCFSGGGIRSATFCLGMLQSFAWNGRLKSFHYLSTVSGGGYIGSWLSNWRRLGNWDWEPVLAKLRVRPPAGAGAAPLHPPDATHAEPQPEGADQAVRDPVSRLRAYSNYLSPIWGLSADGLSLVTIFLRNLLLNWLVWVPLLAALVALPRLYVALVTLRPEGAYWPAALAIVAGLLVVVGIAYVVADLPGEVAHPAGADTIGGEGPQSRFALCCFLPVASAAVVFSVAGVWAWSYREAPWWWFAIGGVAAHLLGVGVGVVWRSFRQLKPRTGAQSLAIGVVTVLASGAAGGVLLWAALRYASPAIDAPGSDVLLYATLSVPLLLGCFWLAMTLYSGWVGPWTTEDDREWWARATAWWLYASLAWALTFALVIYFPPWLFDQLGLRFSAGAQVGVGGALLGVITSAIGYWSKNGTDLKRRASGFLQASGLHLLDLMAAVVILAVIVGLSLALSELLEHCHDSLPVLCRADVAAEASYLRTEAVLNGLAKATDETARLAAASHSAAGQAYLHLMLRADWFAVAAGVAALLAFAFAMSALIGANTFSLHGMYGNRLVRAYLGAGRNIRNPHWFTGFDPDDNCRLADTRPPKGGRLFHVVNIALNLVQASNRRLAWQQRKATSFIATPMHCGADGVGYVTTSTYGDPAGMSLGRAMTISGAAASPNMGYHSSTLVTFVMTLFNVRLGWWLPNPGPGWSSGWSKSEPRVGFFAPLSEAFGRTTDDRASVYLSDGGHFENLGLYEMVRRRCHRIVVVDASCDPEFQYTDLLDAVRKIRIDFGIAIDLPPILPGPGRDTEHARRVVGRIRYSMRDGNSPESDGFLYLVKPRLVGDEPPDITQYAAASHREGNFFPHQSTADQFFDETQFESYRLLGLWSGDASFPMAEGDWPDEDPRKVREAPPGALPAHPGEPSGAAGTAGLTGLTGVVHNFGTGAALATALTVGGTLGVVGTVTMAPGEVHLSKEDRDLLQKGIKINVGLGDGKISLNELTDGARSAIRELQVAADRLREAADKLPTKFEVTGPGGQTQLSELKIKIDGLTKEVAELNIRVAGGGGLSKTTLDAATKAVTDKLEDVRLAVDKIAGKGSAPGSLAEVNAKLDTIDRSLGDVKKAVEGTNPRRNVRGQEGGLR
jgi:hypothetical protein